MQMLKNVLCLVAVPGIPGILSPKNAINRQKYAGICSGKAFSEMSLVI